MEQVWFLDSRMIAGGHMNLHSYRPTCDPDLNIIPYVAKYGIVES